MVILYPSFLSFSRHPRNTLPFRHSDLCCYDFCVIPGGPWFTHFGFGQPFRLVDALLLFHFWLDTDWTTTNVHCGFLVTFSSATQVSKSGPVNSFPLFTNKLNARHHFFFWPKTTHTLDQLRNLFQYVSPSWSHLQSFHSAFQRLKVQVELCQPLASLLTNSQPPRPRPPRFTSPINH